jgi:hypothetical protein
MDVLIQQISQEISQYVTAMSDDSLHMISIIKLMPEILI